MQPRTDGDFMPDTWETALYQNQFNFSGPVVITHQQHESNGSPYPGVSTEADVINKIQLFFPGISADALQQILTLYPSSSYSSQGLRFADIYQSFHHTAKDIALTHALGNATWNGYMQIPPSTHGMDTAYYFYNGAKNINATLAYTLQKYLMSFVMTGNPNTLWPDDKITWQPYNSANSSGVQLVVNSTLGPDTFRMVAGDDIDNERSLFWNKALWY